MSCKTCGGITIRIQDLCDGGASILSEATTKTRGERAYFIIDKNGVQEAIKKYAQACLSEMTAYIAGEYIKKGQPDPENKQITDGVKTIVTKYTNEIIKKENLDTLFNSIKPNGINESMKDYNGLINDFTYKSASILKYINYIFGVELPLSAYYGAGLLGIAKTKPKRQDYTKKEEPETQKTDLAENIIRIAIKNNLLKEESFFDKFAPISTRHLKAYQFLQKWFKTNTPKTIIKQEEKDDVYDAVSLVQKTSLHDRYGFLSVNDIDNRNGRIAPNVKHEILTGYDAGKAVYWGAWELIHGPNKKIFEDLLKVSLEGQIEAVEQKHGREIAHFVLDIAGVIDPIGFFDSVNLGLYAQDYTKASSDEEKQQAFVGMVTSAIGIAVPFIGDALLKPVKLLLQTKKATEAFRIIKGFISRNSETVLKVVEKLTPKNFKPAIDDLKKFLKEGELPKDQNWALQLEKRASTASLAAAEKELKSAIPTLARMIQDNTLGMVLFQAMMYTGLNKAIQSLSERKIGQYVSEFIGSIVAEGMEEAYYTIGTLLVIITNAERDPRVPPESADQRKNLERKQKIYEIVREKIALHPSLSRSTKDSFLEFVRKIDDLIENDIVKNITKAKINENLNNKILINITDKNWLNEGTTAKAWGELWKQAIEGFRRSFIKFERDKILDKVWKEQVLPDIIVRAGKLSVNVHLLEIKKLLRELVDEVDYGKLWSRFKAYRILTKEGAKEFLGKAMIDTRRLRVRLEDESNMLQKEITSHEGVLNTTLTTTPDAKFQSTKELEKLRPAKSEIDQQIKELDEYHAKLEKKIEEIEQKGVPKEDVEASKPKEGDVEAGPVKKKSTTERILNFYGKHRFKIMLFSFSVGEILCRSTFISAAVATAFLKIIPENIAKGLISAIRQSSSFIFGGVAATMLTLGSFKYGLSQVIVVIGSKLQLVLGCAKGATQVSALEITGLLYKANIPQSFDEVTKRFSLDLDITEEELESALYGEFKYQSFWKEKFYKAAASAVPMVGAGTGVFEVDYGKIANYLIQHTDIPHYVAEAGYAGLMTMLGRDAGLQNDPTFKQVVTQFSMSVLQEKFSFLNSASLQQILIVRKFLHKKGIIDSELQTVFINCLLSDFVNNISFSKVEKDASISKISATLNELGVASQGATDFLGVSEPGINDERTLANKLNNLKVHLIEMLQDLNKEISKKSGEYKPMFDKLGLNTGKTYQQFVSKAMSYLHEKERGQVSTNTNNQFEAAYTNLNEELQKDLAYYQNTYDVGSKTDPSYEQKMRYKKNNIQYYEFLISRNKKIYEAVKSNQIDTKEGIEKGLEKFKNSVSASSNFALLNDCTSLKTSEQYKEVYKQALNILDVSKGVEAKEKDEVKFTDSERYGTASWIVVKVDITTNQLVIRNARGKEVKVPRAAIYISKKG